MAGEGGGGGQVFVGGGGGGGGSNIFTVLGDLFGGGGGSNSERRDRAAVAEVSRLGERSSTRALERVVGPNVNFGIPSFLFNLARRELDFRSGAVERPFRPARPPLRTEVEFAAPFTGGFAASEGELDVGAQARRLPDSQPRIDLRIGGILALIDFLRRLFGGSRFPRRTGQRFPAGVFAPQLPTAPRDAGFPPTTGGTAARGGLEVPLFGNTVSGDGGFFGSGPGFDIGDIFGPNSVFSRAGAATSGGVFGLGQDFPAPGQVDPRTGGVPGTTVPLPPGGAGACVPGPFLPTARSGFRAQAFPTCLPGSNRTVWFKPAGRPVLWSDDLAACKRVARVAARTRKSRRGR